MAFTDWQQTQCLFKKNVIYTVDENGKTKLDFFKSQFVTNWELEPSYYSLNCGRCIACQKKYSLQWASRCVLESKLHQENCFITLTYNEANVPPDRNLKKQDYQLFLKRLRKQTGKKIRYFIAGEYGGQTYRPHYHAIIFGWKPNDLKYLKKDGETVLYTSKTLEKIWGKGFTSVGIQMEVNAIKYTAKYLNKLQTMPIWVKQKPFTQASTNPGIGKYALTLEMIEQGGIYINGIKYSLPRYFKKLAADNGWQWELWELQEKQEKLAKANQLTEAELWQERYNYFFSLKKNKISYQHLYNLKDYDAYKLFQNVEKEYKQLEQMLYNK